MSINSVSISGNLTRAAELRTTAGGTDVLSFGVAVNDRRRNPQTEQWEDVANFVDVVVFGNRARALQRHLPKGQKVCVHGKLRYSSWVQDDQRRSKLEVVADDVDLMSRPREADPAVATARAASAPPGPVAVAATPEQVPPPRDVFDEDIPF